MALPGGRQIVVDGRSFEWICKRDKRASSYEEDDWGNDVAIYGKVVTIRASDSGKLIQHRVERTAITPEFVALLIRDSVLQAKL